MKTTSPISVLRFPVVAALLVISLLFLAPGRVSAQGQYSPVTESDMAVLKLNHYFTPDDRPHEVDFQWTFTKTEFVIKKGTGAIPADLRRQLLPKGATADEIRGQWTLTEKGDKRLLLSGIKAGDQDGNKDVSLRIYKTAPTVVRIGEPQYVFGIER